MLGVTCAWASKRILAAAICTLLVLVASTAQAEIMVPDDAGTPLNTATGSISGDGSIILDMNAIAAYKVYVGYTVDPTPGDGEPDEIFDTDIDVLSFDAGKTAPNFFGTGLPQNTVDGSPEENFGELALFGNPFTDPARDMWVNLSPLPLGASLWLKWSIAGGAANFVELAQGIPEPGTVALLASALFGLGLVYFRKRR